MSPIDIDPKTGAPIVVLADKNESKESVSDFVAQVMESTEEKKVDEIPASGPGNPAPQHQHLIDKAREFNQSIGNPSPPPPIVPRKVENLPKTATPMPMTTHAGGSTARVPTAKERVAANPGPMQVRVSPSLMSQIRIVLKDNGMDSQQQEQALQRIGELLQSYRAN